MKLWNISVFESFLIINLLIINYICERIGYKYVAKNFKHIGFNSGIHLPMVYFTPYSGFLPPCAHLFWIHGWCNKNTWSGKRFGNGVEPTFPLSSLGVTWIWPRAADHRQKIQKALILKAFFSKIKREFFVLRLYNG